MILIEKINLKLKHLIHKGEQDFYTTFKTIILDDLDGWPLLGDNYFSDNIINSAWESSQQEANSRRTRQTVFVEIKNDKDNDDDEDEEESDELDDNKLNKNDLESLFLNLTNPNSTISNLTIENFSKSALSASFESTNETLTQTSTQTTTSTESTTTSTIDETTTKTTMSSEEEREKAKQALYTKLIKYFKLGINPFFRVDVDVNPFNNTNFALWIRKPISIRFKSHQIIDANLKFFLRRLVIYLNSSCLPESIDKQVNGTIRLETAFNMVKLDFFFTRISFLTCYLI